MNQLRFLTTRSDEANSSVVGQSADATNTAQACSLTVRLQDNPNFLLTDLPPIVNRVKGIGKCLFAAGATVSLTIFTCLTVFMRRRMVTQGTVHILFQHILLHSAPTNPHFLESQSKKQLAIAFKLMMRS